LTVAGLLGCIHTPFDWMAGCYC